MKVSLSYDGQEVRVTGEEPREPGVVVLYALDAEQTVRAVMTPVEAEEIGLMFLDAADKARGEGMTVDEAVALIEEARGKVRRAKAGN